MRIAILNLSNNITFGNTVSSYETLAYQKLLREQGHTVDIISNKTINTVISFEDASDINTYHHLLVVNGAINFFGGIENPTIIKNFKLMAKFKKPIHYLFTDFRLPFKQLWPAIENRGWGYTKEEVWVDSPIIILSQGADLKMTEKVHPGCTVKYVPLEQYKISLDFIKPIQEPKYDLIYGGSFRSGKRVNEMLEYFFDTEYSAHMFGTIKFKQFKKEEGEVTPPTFGKKEKPYDMIDKTSEGLCTIILGDKEYLNNFITLRVWEAMLSNAVVLIDEKFDVGHYIFPDEDWRYVNSKNDVQTIIDVLKSNSDKRLSAITSQHIRVIEQKEKLDLGKLLTSILEESYED